MGCLAVLYIKVIVFHQAKRKREKQAPVHFSFCVSGACIALVFGASWIVAFGQWKWAHLLAGEQGN